MKKFIVALLASFFFILLLLSIYWIHIINFKVNVLFYSAITDAVIATISAVFILMILIKIKVLTTFEKIQLSIIWLLLGYIFAISVPTVIDRSLSFYILEKIQQRGGGIRLENFENIFTKEYVVEHRLVEVRLTEQRESGTIEIQNGCVLLTTRGKKLVEFSRFFRQNFLPKQRLLMDSYSDALTDPFRHSDPDFSYKCN
jgi:hypothetical protein